MNYRDIIVFDFETGSRNPHKTQPTQIAAIALHGRKLTIQPNGIFNSEIRPILDDKKAIEAGFDPVEEEALKITGKTREALAKAPLPKTVWKSLKISVCNLTLRKALILLSQLATISLGLTFRLFSVCVICTAQPMLEVVRLYSIPSLLDLMDIVFLD